jgi:hypothetical protein
MSLAASIAPFLGLGARVRAGSSRTACRASHQVARARPSRGFTPSKFSKTRRIGLVPRASGDPEASDSGSSDTTRTTEKTPESRFKRRAPDAAPPKASPLGAGPSAMPISSIKVIPVEQRSRDAFQGVAKVDGKDDTGGRVPILIAGDIAAIVLFAAIGRGNHGEGLFISDVLATAAPFLVGWFGSAPVTKTFGKDATGNKPGPAAASAAKGWAVGIPLGLLLRGISKGAVPPKPFIAVTLVATGVFLVGWRAWFAQSSGGDEEGNKKGNPLEFMGLLMSLTKRW